MSMTEPDKKRRRQDSPEDSNVPVVDLVSSSDESDEKENKREEINYPKSMLKEIEAVHSNIQKNRLKAEKAAKPASDSSASSKNSSSSSAPPEVFIAFHQELCTYGDNTFDVIGTYSRVEAANEQVLKLFKAEYAQCFNDSGDSDDGSDGGYGEDRSFVKGRPGEGSRAEDNQVQWCIDGHGALSLEVHDAAEGDIYKVYTLRQEVQP
jgi:hypothetical protein